MHVYQLLAPKQGQEFRARLGVTYRDGKAYSSGVFHMCVTYGKVAGFDPNDPWQLEEDRRVLADLLEIKQKYVRRLKGASWNKG